MVGKTQQDKQQRSSKLQPQPAVGTSSEALDLSSSPIFFHKEWEDFGFMSNFYLARFTAPDPATWLPAVVAQSSSTASASPGGEATALPLITFQHSEQYYMYRKALCFSDGDAAKRILDATSPADCKDVGRAVRGFSEEVWSEEDLKVRVMEEALWWKFGGGQLESLLTRDGEQDYNAWMSREARMGHLNDPGRKLLATGHRQLLEAAGRDRYWGIGYGKKQRPQN
ncbi:hypothetical protein VMCG_02523 [Cytospora schulzeri]|uniref:NADAR domain-containing protein n=1 Tax=Cytospora schulzeri TaxID=448051 RepID=A0A423X213_9PEZI|nr:hypothetical protein VMCG_02523 [Valsa malicola]